MSFTQCIGFHINHLLDPFGDCPINSESTPRWSRRIALPQQDQLRRETVRVLQTTPRLHDALQRWPSPTTPRLEVVALSGPAAVEAQKHRKNMRRHTVCYCDDSIGSNSKVVPFREMRVKKGGRGGSFNLVATH